MSRAKQDCSEWDVFIIALRVIFFIFFCICLFTVSIHDKLLSGSSWTCIESGTEIIQKQWVAFGNKTSVHPGSVFVPEFNETWIIHTNTSCLRYALIREAEE